MGKGAATVKSNIEQMEDNKDVKGLINALNDENDDIRFRAAEALGRIGDPAVGPLIRALNDENVNIRWGTAKALEYMRCFHFVEQERGAFF
jgi:HEAT repeat protein